MSLNNLQIATYLDVLATALFTRYGELGNNDDLQYSILLYRKVVSLLHVGHPGRSLSLGNLASALCTRYGLLGKRADIEESIALGRDRLSLHPLGHPDHSKSVINLAAYLSTRHTVLGEMADLEEAISLQLQGLRLIPFGNPNRSMCLNNLALSLSSRYGLLGKTADLEESISLHREALNLCPYGHPVRSKSLNNLATSLASRYGLLGKMADLEESISLHHEALSLRSHGHPDRSSSLNNLAASLSIRYRLLGKTADLGESIALHREGLSLCPYGHPDRPSSLSNLATSLSTCYGISGKMADLEESISLHREALSLYPYGHRDRSMCLNNITTSLSSRYRLLGKMADLEDSISLQREALSLRPHGHSDRSMCLNNIAADLTTRFNLLGKIGDLEESISLYREALSLYPYGHPDRSKSLDNLATSLSTRYDAWKKMEDLEESIALHREALSLRPHGHPDRSSALNNLAMSLSILYTAMGKMADLEESISRHREALSLRPDDHPDRSSSLINLATSLSTRYGILEQMADLEESISLQLNGLRLHPVGHPNRCNSLSSLATLYLTHFRKSHQQEHFRQAFHCLALGACDSTSFSRDRLKAAIGWAILGRPLQDESMFVAYRLSLELLNRCMISYSSLESQQTVLAISVNIPGSLACDAASAAIEAGRTELAIEFLEQGRAMLWSKVHGFKSPPQQLREVEGGNELADRLEVIGAQLEHLAFLSNNDATSDMDASTKALSDDARMKQHRLLSEEWEDLKSKIRDIEGFRHFLRTPPFDDLQLAATDGPVILVNVSEYRSDAIILLKDSPPVLVPLPELRLDELKAQKLGSPREITKTLCYLWDNIVSLVVVRLTELNIPKKSRIWWCPTSVLCAFPLHAAGRGRKNLQDIYTSSYTSTLSSLIKARSSVVRSAAAPKLLVVGQPSTRQALKRVKDEVDAIKSLRPGDATDVLFGADAHSQAVLDGLKEHPWVHLACHGHLGDDNQPFQASFELQDRRLPLLDIIRSRLQNAELAFLSACHSAEGDSVTPDETIHLSAALQFCGFRSVIGTLWEMDDEDGPVISKLFYEYMFRNGPEKVDFRDSAHALNFALRQMKEDGVPIDRLALFVHNGA